MGNMLPHLNDFLIEFIKKQQIFFVATAAKEGRINLSPKGGNYLKVINKQRVVWLNLTGSGNETAAHLLDVNRMTIMFCAFEGQALILRLYGSAKTIHPRESEWGNLIQLFDKTDGARQIFDLTIKGVLSSCGKGVPFMAYEKERLEDELGSFYQRKGEQGIKDYWLKKNALSIDGKPTGIFSES